MPSTSLENAVYHCKEKVGRDLSSLHYALLFQSEIDRAFWLGCFTLLHEIRRATQQQLEAGLTQVKLGWWRHALTEVQAGAVNHPVLVALGEKALSALNEDQWGDLIAQTVDASEMTRHNSLVDWLANCSAPLKHWSAVVAAHHDLPENESIQAFWAASTALTQLLRLAKYVDEGFQPIPVDWLAKQGVTAEQLKRREHDAATVALFTHTHEQVTQSADAAWKQLPAQHRLALRPLRALYRMRQAEFAQHKQGGLLLLKEQTTLTPWKKFSVSWTTHVLRR